MDNHEETLGIYIRNNRYTQQFELIQQEDGFVYDRKFHTEYHAKLYLKELVTTVKKYIT